MIQLKSQANRVAGWIRNLLKAKEDLKMDERALLQSIGQMLDEKLNTGLGAFEKKLDKKLDKRFEAFEEKLDKKLDKRFEASEEKMSKRFNQMDERFDQMDERFDQVEDRLGKVEGRLDGVEGRLGKMELTIENELRPNIQMLVEGHQVLYDKMCTFERKYVDIPEKVEVLTSVVKSHTRDIELLKASKTS